MSEQVVPTIGDPMPEKSNYLFLKEYDDYNLYVHDKIIKVSNTYPYNESDMANGNTYASRPQNLDAIIHHYNTNNPTEQGFLPTIDELKVFINIITEGGFYGTVDGIHRHSFFKPTNGPELYPVTPTQHGPYMWTESEGTDYYGEFKLQVGAPSNWYHSQGGFIGSRYFGLTLDNDAFTEESVLLRLFQRRSKTVITAAENEFNPEVRGEFQYPKKTNYIQGALGSNALSGSSLPQPTNWGGMDFSLHNNKLGVGNNAPTWPTYDDRTLQDLENIKVNPLGGINIPSYHSLSHTVSVYLSQTKPLSIAHAARQFWELRYRDNQKTEPTTGGFNNVGDYVTTKLGNLFSNVDGPLTAENIFNPSSTDIKPIKFSDFRGAGHRGIVTRVVSNFSFASVNLTGTHVSHQEVYSMVLDDLGPIHLGYYNWSLTDTTLYKNAISGSVSKYYAHFDPEGIQYYDNFDPFMYDKPNTIKKSWTSEDPFNRQVEQGSSTTNYHSDRGKNWTEPMRGYNMSSYYNSPYGFNMINTIAASVKLVDYGNPETKLNDIILQHKNQWGIED